MDLDKIKNTRSERTEESHILPHLNRKMPEPISIALSLGLGYAVLYGYGRSNTAISSEADSAKKAVAELLESKERSQSLFGKKAMAISALRKMANECADEDWDGYGAGAIDPLSVWNAEDFIRALPDNLPMPEVSPEPDGSVSLDWIRSRNQIFSVSIGANNRLAYAWLDGTERGHSVFNFDGTNTPQRMLADLSPSLKYGPVALSLA